MAAAKAALEKMRAFWDSQCNNEENWAVNYVDGARGGSRRDAGGGADSGCPDLCSRRCGAGRRRRFTLGLKVVYREDEPATSKAGLEE
ncbi:uncharacterized protein [Aegilops tauschii subsp. strangulata]|uniref:uncharacterized protein n=1 Tax=Aegilops tauschii subsp. strangulata TaxID=200361 RepID=UPI001ABCF37D